MDQYEVDTSFKCMDAVTDLLKSKGYEGKYHLYDDLRLLVINSKDRHKNRITDFFNRHIKYKVSGNLLRIWLDDDTYIEFDHAYIHWRSIKCYKKKKV